MRDSIKELVFRTW